jgi:integrase
MKKVKIEQLINTALKELIALKLSDGSIKSYRNRTFQPILEFYRQNEEDFYHKELMDNLCLDYQEQLASRTISQNTFNLRIRGVCIINELFMNDYFHWRVFVQAKENQLPKYYMDILSEFLDSLGDIKRIKTINSIAKRYFLVLYSKGHQTLDSISAIDIRMFIVEVSPFYPKSMDDVVSTLKKIHMFLCSKAISNISFESVLCAPRARDRKIQPCISFIDIKRMLEQIDTNSIIGKRDYAVLQLGICLGLRAGDIAKLQLTDIDWRNNEIHLIQGKTKQPLSLPLVESVGNAMIDYILRGRPISVSPFMFLRSVAPYQQFHDGVSISCIFRKYLKKAGISHMAGDGKTFHGFRRTIGTEMIVQEIPVTTVAQVLGHRSIESSKQYISLNVGGLRQCALSFGSIGRGGL